jgi:GT2 family glycosyltransferase
MIDLSIIIVSWNTQDLLHSCLSSIFKHQPRFPLQVIVVDNASNDGSREMMQKEFPVVRLLENPKNMGFAAANNQGAKTASAPLLLFLNSDTQVHSETLAGAVSFMNQHPEAGIMGCRTLNPDGSLQATAFAFPSKLRIFAYVSGLNRFFKLSRFTDHSTICTPDYVQGSFLIIRKDVFGKCGGFDESFFLYAEEIDLCLRAKALGLTIYYYPDISITHYGGSSGKNSLACLRHFVRSNINLYQKYLPPKEEKTLLKVLKSALLLRLFWEFVFSPLKFKNRKNDIKIVLHDLYPMNDEKCKQK